MIAFCMQGSIQCLKLCLPVSATQLHTPLCLLPTGVPLPDSAGGPGRKLYCLICGCDDVGAVCNKLGQCCMLHSPKEACLNMQLEHAAACNATHRWKPTWVCSLLQQWLTPHLPPSSAATLTRSNAGTPACWLWPSAVGPTLSSSLGALTWHWLTGLSVCPPPWNHSVTAWLTSGRMGACLAL